MLRRAKADMMKSKTIEILHGLNRREALALLGGLGASAFVGGALTTAPAVAQSSVDCVLTPDLTEGPYFVDEKLNRSDIRTALLHARGLGPPAPREGPVRGVPGEPPDPAGPVGAAARPAPGRSLDVAERQPPACERHGKHDRGPAEERLQRGVPRQGHEAASEDDHDHVYEVEAVAALRERARGAVRERPLDPCRGQRDRPDEQCARSRARHCQER